MTFEGALPGRGRCECRRRWRSILLRCRAVFVRRGADRDEHRVDAARTIVLLLRQECVVLVIGRARESLRCAVGDLYGKTTPMRLSRCFWAIFRCCEARRGTPRIDSASWRFPARRVSFRGSSPRMVIDSSARPSKPAPLTASSRAREWAGRRSAPSVSPRAEQRVIELRSLGSG